MGAAGRVMVRVNGLRERRGLGGWEGKDGSLGRRLERGGTSSLRDHEKEGSSIFFPPQRNIGRVFRLNGNCD